MFLTQRAFLPLVWMNSWAYIGKKFTNVIKPNQLPDILDQVAQMKVQKKVREATNELTPTLFFFELSKVDNKYLLVSKLALALLTAHNSSSSAERDISQMNSILADPRTRCTKQLRLQTRLKMRSSTHNLRLKCEDCKQVKLQKWQRKNETDTNETSDEEEEEEEEQEKVIKGEKSSHCHLFEVDEELMAKMKNGQPWQRYKDDLKKKRDEEIIEKRIMEPAKKADEEKAKKDTKIELQRLRRKLKEDAHDKSKQAKPKQLTDAETKEAREQRRREIQLKRDDKRKEWFLAFAM